MIKSNLKKHIIFFSVALLFFPLLTLPGSTNAQTISTSLYITPAKTAVKVNEYVEVKATVVEVKTKEVRFFSYPQVQGFQNIAKCTPVFSKILGVAKNEYICSVKFKSSTAGTYELNASMTDEKGKVIQSNKPIIKVGDVKTEEEIDPPTESLNISITADKSVIAKEEKTKINVKTDKPKGGEVFSFSANKEDGTPYMETEAIFTPKTCTADTSGSCFVEFSSNSKKTFNIKTSATISGKTYDSASISIAVGEEVSTKSDNPDTNTTYTPLASLPGMEGPIDTKLSVSNTCPLGNYLNIIFKLIIGISAVLAMVMLVMAGMEYMTSDLISSKEEAKSSIMNAILGLLILLGSVLILRTINPEILSSCLNDLPSAEMVISDFVIPPDSPLSSSFGNVNPVKINFNKQAYPAAKLAEQKTGVKASLILAIFQQETSGGRNTGRCRYYENKANMSQTQITYLRKITSELGMDINNTPVACAMVKNGVFEGSGGAIGLTQALPSTWESHKDEVKNNLGKSSSPSPWDVNDAIMFTGVFLKHKEGATNPRKAACAYFNGSCDDTKAANSEYAKSVMNYMASIEKQIAEAIKKGEIKP